MTHQKPIKRFFPFTGLLLVLNGLVILLLLISYLSVYLNPKDYPMISFFGLGYPIILAANLGFAVLWLMVKPRFSLLSIAFMLLGWNHLGRLVQFNTSPEIAEESQVVKILSYNIQNYVKENTSTMKYIRDFKNQDKINDFILNQGPDIICLQEVLYDKDDFQDFPKLMAKRFNCENYYFRNYYPTRTNKIDAILILTKYPIIDKGFFEYSEKTFGIFCDIRIDSDTLRLYNLHLSSIHFRKEDYEFISDITSQQSQEEFKTSTRKVISKMNTAFIKRGHQTDLLKLHIRQSPYPVIVCGDFNDTPISYAYRNISNGLNDAFIESGKGLGITYAGKNFPAFRIDYILHDARYQSVNFQKHKISFSDHFPISCNLLLDR